VLTALPLVMLVYSSFRTTAPGLPGEFTLDGYVNAYTDPDTYATFVNSFLLAAQVTLISTLLAVLFAWAVARTDMPGKRLALPLMALIYAMPTIFFALGWAMLGNPRAGLLNHLVMSVLPLESPPFNTNSWGGMVFVMTLTSVPFKFLLLLGAFKAMDISLEESSRMSGAGKTRTLLYIGLPILAPTILGVMILGFVRAIQSLEIPLFLGFPAEIYVFSTRIYDQIANRFPPQYAEAGALAIALIATMIVLILAQWRILGKREFFTVTGKGYRPDIWRLGRWRWLLTAILAVYVTLSLVMPLTQMVIGSLQPLYGLYNWQFTLDNYLSAFERPSVQRAIRNTVLIAVGGGFVTMALTTLVANVVTRTRFTGRRLLDFFAWLPWTLPGIVLGLGMLWAYLSVPGLKLLYGTPFLLLIGVTVTVIPVGVRVMAGAFSQVSPALEESARIHGASWTRAFTGIVLRITSPTFVYGWLVVGIIISGELAVPLLLYSPGTEMLGVAILDLSQLGKLEESAAVFCVVLGAIALSFVVVTVLTKLLRAVAVRMQARSGTAPMQGSGLQVEAGKG
jgi:iron(III) transport system permease protein